MRLPSLLHDGLWRDQANVYVQVTAPSLHEFFQRMIATEWHPPLYFVIALVWAHLAGTSEIALTILPFGCAIATVIAVYWLGAAVHSRSAGLVASFLYAVAPLTISYATEYVYPFAELVFTMLALAVVRARSQPTAGRLVAVAVLSTFAVYSHYTALLYVPPLVVWCLLGKQRVAAALLAGLIPFAGWFPIFWAQRHIGVPYAPSLTLLQTLQFIPEMAVRVLPVYGMPQEALFAAFLIGALIVAARNTARFPDAFALGAIFGAVLCAVVMLNLLEARYVVPVYALFCVFTAYAGVRFGDEIEHRNGSESSVLRRVFVAAVALAFVLPSAAYAVARSTVPKSGIRTLAETHALAPHAFYVIAPDYLAATFEYYTRDAHVPYAGFVRRDHPEVFRLSGYSNDWNAQSAAATAIPLESSASRYKYLDLILDARAHDEGHVPYGKVWSLLRVFRARYRLVTRATYNGRDETVTDYRFLLSQAAAER